MERQICPDSSRRSESAVRQITMAGQKSIDRDVFVQRFPVNATRADFELSELFGRSGQ